MQKDWRAKNMKLMFANLAWIFNFQFRIFQVTTGTKDGCFKVTILKEATEISREVIKLVKDSAQRDTKVKAIRS